MSTTDSRSVLRLQAWRELHATREAVFDALVNPAKHQGWLAPPGAWGDIESTVDLRVGGVWESRFSPTPVARVHDTQTYVEIDPPNRLVTDLVSEGTMGGQPIPPVHSRIQYRLEPSVWGTLLTVEQEGFPDEQTRDFFETVVWVAALDRLEAFLTPGT